MFPSLEILLGLPFALALIVALSRSASRRTIAWIAASAPLLGLVVLAWLTPAVIAGDIPQSSHTWIPQAGLFFTLRLDGLAWMFAGLVLGIGALIVMYARYYLSSEDSPQRFFAYLLLFMGSMLGMVISGNLLLLVVFWELTSISSFLLIGFWTQRNDAREGARMALAITGAGGLALLGGVLLIGRIVGSYELDVVLASGELIRAHALYPAVLGLVLLGVFTKSAQFPFHFWLPHAMAAPTPVSAYLHSATMVKAGVFLLARLHPVLAGSELFFYVVSAVGATTLLLGAWYAIFQHDLKGLLAYSTISHLGLITLLFGLSTPLAVVAGLFHILNHATFKASLFMAAGIIDHETGSRDMRQLGGLFKLMPWTATLAMVAAAAMAGVPLANGFLSKELFFAEAVGARHSFAFGLAVPVLATLGGIFAVAYSLRFIHDVFFNGPPKDLPKPHPHEPPLFMKLPVALLVLWCLAVGVLPALTVGPIVQLAATAMLGTAPPPYHLALWHGVNLPLLMSALALVGGVAFYIALQRRFDLHLHHPRGLTGRLLFNRAMAGLMSGASWLITRLENGSLQRHVAVLLGAALAAAAWPFAAAVLAGAGLPAAGSRPRLPADGLSLLTWALLLATCAALLRGHRQRLQAVVLVGVIGLVTALTFVALSAPDLALTQLSVELVSAVLLLMGLALLPPFSPKTSPETGSTASPKASSRWRTGRDGLLAAAGGVGMAGLSWLVMTREHHSISGYFLDHALTQGGGSNVVNVILVDFRGYDTFGEITVLAIAALGVLALLDGWRVRRPGADAAGRAWTFAQPPLMLRRVARLVLPLALVLSVHLFWRGHNLPGGGFIAGLVTAVALVLQYLALGQSRADALLHAAGGGRFVRWIGVGLGLALLTGAAAMALGRPFFTSAFGHPVLPLLGELSLASAAVFDLGVYVTVVGATLLMLSVLGAAGKGTVATAAATPAGRAV